MLTINNFILTGVPKAKKSPWARVFLMNINELTVERTLDAINWMLNPYTTKDDGQNIYLSEQGSHIIELAETFNELLDNIQDSILNAHYNRYQFI